MKKILLASASIVAFAGVAAAEVDLSGSATLGYNDVAAGGNDGFYSEVNLDASLSATLDNGITVTVAADVDELDNPDNSTAADVTMTISSETASLVYGDTTAAANDTWSAVGSMDNDGFYEDGDALLKGTVTFGDVTASVSYLADNGATEATEMSVGATATLGGASVALAYQAGGAVTGNEILALRAGMTVGGADVAVGYASNQTADTNSTGVSVTYPVGPVALTASYVVESGAADDNWDIKAVYTAGAVSATVYTDESDDWGIDASYDVGNGLKVFGGLDDAGDTTYLAATYDLGGGASLLGSFVDTNAANSDDEYGAGDYQEGTTVAVSFSF